MEHCMVLSAGPNLDHCPLLTEFLRPGLPGLDHVFAVQRVKGNMACLSQVVPPAV